jgi:hypothetical protein
MSGGLNWRQKWLHGGFPFEGEPMGLFNANNGLMKALYMRGMKAQ